MHKSDRGKRKEERGHDWNSSERSGSNLDRGTQERVNGFRLLLFALSLRFVWSETFSPHVPLSLTIFLSVDISVLNHSLSIDIISAWGVNLLSPHKHKTYVPLTLIKPTDNLSEKLDTDREEGLYGFEGAQDLMALKQPESPSLTQKREHSGLNPNTDPSACCTQEIKKTWWNEWGKQRVWSSNSKTRIDPVWE